MSSSSILLGNGTKSSATGGSGASLKRKYSQDGGGRMSSSSSAASLLLNGGSGDSSTKRLKCSHPSMAGLNHQQQQQQTASSVGGGSGIATNTIMITNNYSSGKTPLSSTSTSNSSQITILAQHDDDDDDDDDLLMDVGGSGLGGGEEKNRRRPMVVDQINICINNHFSSDAALMTTTASATAKLPDLIKIQKKTTTTNKQKTKLGYEAEVKEEQHLANGDSMLVDVEQQVQGFTIKKEPLEELELKEEKEGNKSNIDSQQAVEKQQNPKSFSIGEEVLVSIDSCNYLGILTVLRGDQCLVQFEDGTNCWASVKEIRRLQRQPNTVYCVICKTREERRSTETAAAAAVHDCVRCGRVYHKACLVRELNQLAKKVCGGSGGGENVKLSEKTNCLRCFKRSAGIDLSDDEEEEEDETVDVESRGGGVMIKSNSSNTGKSTNAASSVIGHHHHSNQQVEIGAPSMDWFTKEKASGSAAVDAEIAEDEEEAAVIKEEATAAAEEEFYKDANGRRLRKRQQKRNYKDIQRVSMTNSHSSGTASSWSCASSTSSSSTSSSSATPALLVSPFAASGSSQFTLDELRWAFLPKSHKSFRRRSTKKVGLVGAAEKKSVKVPYEKTTATTTETGSSSSSSSSRTSSRRASREAAAAASVGVAVVAEYTMMNRRDVKLLTAGGDGSSADTKARLAKGETFVVRGKRQDSQGNVQYLIEWTKGVGVKVKQEAVEEEEEDVEVC